MVHIVTYSLKNRSRSYEPLFAAIKANSAEWWHYIDSTWIVVTGLTADQYAQLLLPHIETTDFILVSRLMGDHQGWLPREAWDWLVGKQF